MPSVIMDGYTFDGTVPAIPRLYDAINFRYRPALPVDVYAYRRSSGKGTPAQELQNDAEFVAEHLIEWDVTDRNGAAVKPTADVLKRIYNSALLTIINHITGYTSPQKEASEKN